MLMSLSNEISQKHSYPVFWFRALVDNVMYRLDEQDKPDYGDGCYQNDSLLRKSFGYRVCTKLKKDITCSLLLNYF